MTLQELYQSIDGNYEQAMRIMRVEKLLDKHIRKLTKNGVIPALLDAGQDMDPAVLFDAAHAAKGVCANLGLTGLAAAASELSEEFRPGNPRRMSDDEVRDRLRAVAALYRKTADGIARYENG